MNLPNTGEILVIWAAAENKTLKEMQNLQSIPEVR